MQPNDSRLFRALARQGLVVTRDGPATVVRLQEAPDAPPAEILLPATLPLEVLEQAQSEMTNWKSSGMSVMEVSHRSKAFIAVAQEAEADLRELLAVPANYKVLFLQGGATGMFSAIPMNLATADSTVDYVNTGAWSKKAIGEAKRYCKVVNVSADEAASNYSTVPAQSALKLTPGAAYVHYTPNETIGGVEFDYVPETNGVPLVADFSSTILSTAESIRLTKKLATLAIPAGSPPAATRSSMPAM